MAGEGKQGAAIEWVGDNEEQDERLPAGIYSVALGQSVPDSLSG